MDGGGPWVGTAPDAGAVAGRPEVDEVWLGTGMSASELIAAPAVVCWVGRSGCGGSAGIASV